MDNGAEPQGVAASSIISQNSALAKVMFTWAIPTCSRVGISSRIWDLWSLTGKFGGHFLLSGELLWKIGTTFGDQDPSGANIESHLGNPGCLSLNLGGLSANPFGFPFPFLGTWDAF